MQTMALLAIPVFLFSLVIHEVAHAWTAKLGGDMTAAYLGRLSLNPLAHLDPIGTGMIVLGALTGLPLIGWAKPVPVNTVKFRNPRWLMWVALAGPASNLALALIFAGIWRGFVALNLFYLLNSRTALLSLVMVQLFVFANVCLMIFNLIPVPPLDGSKVFFYLFVRGRGPLFDAFVFLERFGFFLLLILFFSSATREVFFRIVMTVANVLLGSSAQFS